MKTIVLFIILISLFGCSNKKGNDRLIGTGIFQKASLVESNDAFLFDSICYSSGATQYIINGSFNLESSVQSFEVIYRISDSIDLVSHRMIVDGVEFDLRVKLVNDELTLNWVKSKDSLRIRTGIVPI